MLQNLDVCLLFYIFATDLRSRIVFFVLRTRQRCTQDTKPNYYNIYLF